MPIEPIQSTSSRITSSSAASFVVVVHIIAEKSGKTGKHPVLQVTNSPFSFLPYAACSHTPQSPCCVDMPRGNIYLISVVVVVFRTEGGSLHRSSTRSSHLGSLDSTVALGLWDEFHRFSIGQTAESLGLDFGLVNEEVRATIIGNDETISLQRVEPK